MNRTCPYVSSILIGLTLFVAAPSMASAADFYKGKTLRVIVGYSPGGGYDVYSRFIARHISKHIPGHPKMLVENRPGAGGLIAANYLYHSQRQDGTEMLHVGSSVMIKQFTGAKAVKYDAEKFQYIGAPFTNNTVMVVTKNSGFTNIQDLLGGDAREIALGGISVGSPQDVAATLLRDVIGLKVRLVTGYGGSSKIRAAMERGEVDGFFISWDSLTATSSDKLNSGDYVVLLQVSETPIREIPNIPSILELAKSKEQRRLIRLTTLVPYQFARSFFVGPKVPEERVRTLQGAFDKTMMDPAFLSEAKRARLEVDPVKASKVRSSVLEFFNTPAEDKTKVVKLLTGTNQ
jgi:tripartite-type tricarboxylate transporter receptor subunit TctC